MSSTVSQSNGQYRIRLAAIPSYARDIPESPLGALGDIPVAYAVFKIEADKEAEKSKTAYFLYANNEYCRLTGCKAEDILGVSHLEFSNSEDAKWPVDCYQAAFCGKTSNGITFSPLVQSWICYNIAPASVKGCCTYAFIPIDEQQRKQQMSIDEKTSLIISELLTTLAGEKSYEAAMNDMLEKTAQITHAERVCVFECYGPQTEITFERCAEGVPPQVGTVSALSSGILKAWFKSMVENPVMLVPDVTNLERFSPALYNWCVESDVKSLLTAPFYNEGEIVGFLGAYNYALDESFDIKRVFSEIRSFVGARIDNRRLIENLDWAGKHDALTGLLNRRGFAASLEKALAEKPDAPVVIAIIDLDDFKQINDHYGHACGDEALCAMGRFMGEMFPKDAILCRTGGDEFLVCLVGDSAARIDELVEKFKVTVIEYEYEGVRRTMTASIGYSQHTGQSFHLQEAFAEADKALYAVKRSSKPSH